MGKLLDSPASFRPISLTFCLSKLFERIILSRLLFLLKYSCILSPRQASLHPDWSALDQILYFSRSISDEFPKPNPGSRTILAVIGFSSAFDFVWHPAFFYKLISTGFPPCFVLWTQSLLSDWRASVVFQNHQSRSFFESVKVFCKNTSLALFFSSMTSLRLYLLTTGVLFVLPTWPSGLSVSTPFVLSLISLGAFARCPFLFT